MLDTMNLAEFLAKTASGKPVPGGGSISALAAAAAAALAEMTANLTIGGKGYEQQEAEMQEIAGRAAELRKEMVTAVSRDAEAFQKVMAAQRLPRTTEQENRARAAAIEAALKNAARVPLDVARHALTILDMSKTVVEKGNPNAVTDGAVAAMMARTAVLGALYNVKINLCSIKDKTFTAELAAEVQDMEKIAVDKEKMILEAVDFERIFSEALKW